MKEINVTHTIDLLFYSKQRILLAQRYGFSFFFFLSAFVRPSLFARRMKKVQTFSLSSFFPSVGKKFPFQLALRRTTLIIALLLLTLTTITLSMTLTLKGEWNKVLNAGCL